MHKKLLIYYAQSPIGWELYALMAVVCLSICLSHA